MKDHLDSKLFVLFIGKNTHQIRRHFTDEIVAVHIGELSSAGPRFNKVGVRHPVPLLSGLSWTIHWCLALTRKLAIRGYAENNMCV